jgi:PhnB protein
MPVPFAPPGQPVLSPYLVVTGAAEAIAFYQRALGAEERYRLAMPDGRIGHAELRFGDAILMLADAFPEQGIRAPAGDERLPVTLSLYVEDVGATMARAVAAGARVTRPLQDQFYGDRTCEVLDPFGYRWHLATHVEDVPPEELRRRMAAGAAG